MWDALSADLQAIVAHACAAEANFALAEMERLNAQALVSLTQEHGVKLAAFPDDLVAARSEISGLVHASYMAFRTRSAPWSRISIEAVLRARGA